MLKSSHGRAILLYHNFKNKKMLPRITQQKADFINRYISYITVILEKLLTKWLAVQTIEEDENASEFYEILPYFHNPGNKKDMLLTIKEYFKKYPLFTSHFICDDFTFSGIVRISYTAITCYCYHYVSSKVDEDAGYNIVDAFFCNGYSTDMEKEVANKICKLLHVEPIIPNNGVPKNFASMDRVFNNPTESNYNVANIAYSDNGLTIFFNITEE